MIRLKLSFRLTSKIVRKGRVSRSFYLLAPVLLKKKKVCSRGVVGTLKSIRKGQHKMLPGQVGDLDSWNSFRCNEAREVAFVA